MTSHNWQDVYDYACKAFGQTPRPEDEQAIIDHFNDNPGRVIAEIDRIANQLNDGNIRWAWSAWAASTRHQPRDRNIQADDAATRANAIRRAEQWITNAGIHYDQPTLEAELYGDNTTRGRLHDYRQDQPLKDHLLQHWQTHRPRGQQAETDYETWNDKCRQDRQGLQASKAKSVAETDIKLKA